MKKTFIFMMMAVLVFSLNTAPVSSEETVDCKEVWKELHELITKRDDLQKKMDVYEEKEEHTEDEEKEYVKNEEEWDKVTDQINDLIEKFNEKCGLKGSVAIKMRDGDHPLTGAKMEVVTETDEGERTIPDETGSDGTFKGFISEDSAANKYKIRITLDEAVTPEHAGKSIRWYDQSDNTYSEISVDIPLDKDTDPSNISLNPLPSNATFSPEGLTKAQFEYAMKAYVKINKALKFMEELGLKPPNQVKVYLNAPKSKHDGADGSVYIGAESNSESKMDFPTMLWHEMGHHADLINRGRNTYSTAGGTPANHHGANNPNSSDAVVEGFAEWFALQMKQRDKTNTHQSQAPNTYEWSGGNINLEDNNETNVKKRRPKGTSGVDLGEEFGVAGIMLDLTDGKSDADSDHIELDPKTMLEAMKHGTTIQELYAYLANLASQGKLKNKDGSSVSLDQVKEVFKAHGVHHDFDNDNKVDDDEIGYTGGTKASPRKDLPTDFTENRVKFSTTGTVDVEFHTKYSDSSMDGIYGFEQYFEVSNGDYVNFWVPDHADAFVEIYNADSDELLKTVSAEDFWNNYGTDPMYLIDVEGGETTEPDGNETKEMAFDDVAEGDPFYDDIKYLKEEEISSGIDGKYFPKNNTTRAEITKIAVLACGVETDPDATKDDLPFTDITSEYDWLLEYLSPAYEAQVISGYEDATFKPSRNVTRDEGVKILLGACDMTLHDTTDLPFDDVDSDSTLTQYVITAYEEGIVSGYSATVFGPKNPITRGEIAKIIHKMLTK